MKRIVTFIQDFCSGIAARPKHRPQPPCIDCGQPSVKGVSYCGKCLEKRLPVALAHVAGGVEECFVLTGTRYEPTKDCPVCGHAWRRAEPLTHYPEYVYATRYVCKCGIELYIPTDRLRGAMNGSVPN